MRSSHRRLLERGAFVLLILAVAGVLAAAVVTEPDPAPLPAGRDAVPVSTDVSLDVEEVQVVAPTSAEGRRRDRLRLVIPVTVVNGTMRTVEPSFRLQFAGRSVAPDRASTFERDTQVARGARATGDLRFELAGDETDALRRASRTVLRLRVRNEEPVEVPVVLDVPAA